MSKEHDLYQVSLKVILKNNKDEVLILGGIPGGSYDGFYDLPGGRINKDEFDFPLEKVLKREIKEEVGNIDFDLKSVPVAVGRHLFLSSVSGLSEDVHVLYLFFEASYLSGEIRVSKEHIGYKWLNLKECDLSKTFKSGNLEGIRMYLETRENN